MPITTSVHSSFFVTLHSSLHRDHNNTDSPNLVVPITAFEGGGVWVEHEGGQDFRWHQGVLVAGRTHSFQDGPLYLLACPDPSARDVALGR